jgi:HOOK domain
MTQYFSDVLRQPTDGLEVPDLQAIAKDRNVSSTLMMCRLTLAIAVQCDKNKEFIEKIQSLSEANQHYLMKAIEQVLVEFSEFAILTQCNWYLGYGQGPTSLRRSNCQRAKQDRVSNDLLASLIISAH